MISAVRPAVEQDVPHLVELEAVLFPNSMTDTLLQRELSVGEGYVIDFQRKPVAYALVRRDQELLDLTRLGVEPLWQGTGLGTRLLRHVLTLGRPTVLHVLKDNARALHLYRGHGFRIVAHLREAGSWVMRWDPDASDRPAA